MENRKPITFLVPTILLGLFVFSAPQARAYGIETHAYLTSEIINFYNQNNSNQFPSELRNYLIDGSRKEDETPRWLNHFYDPVNERGLTTSYGIKGYSSKTWGQDASKQSEARFKVTHFIASLLSAAEQRKVSEISADANFTWNRAIEFYAQGGNEKAMFALGHVLHLIEDAGVPDHTRNDDHPTGSPYEDFAMRFILSNPDNSLAGRVSGRGMPTFSNLDTHFNSLAIYSNNSFYSLDTIGINSGYNLPIPYDYEILGDLRFARARDDQGFYKLFSQSAGASYLVDFQGEVTVDDEKVMADYWSRLSPKVVQNGAGVINLFFQEAEKAKNDPRFAKKEKKNFLTKIVDAAKAAVSQIFNKSGNKPTAVIDVNKQSQQKPANNLTASVVPIQGQAVPAPKKTTAAPPKKEIAKAPEKKTQETKQEKAVKQSVQECSFDTDQSPSRSGIIINEVAWMGGSTSAGLGASDEWIELKNLTDQPINISGWQVVDQNEDIQAVFNDGSQIPANGFYLLERTDDDSVPGVGADAIYSGALANSNEGLRVFDASCALLDEVLASSSWPAGDNSSRRTMQRESSLSWSTYSGSANNSVFGTPKAENGLALVVKEKDTPKKDTDETSKITLNQEESDAAGETTPTQADVLITEVQITGGSGKTSYDFVEIFNLASSSVNLNGHRLVKRTKTGISDTTLKSWTSDTIVPANSYYLWANSGHAELGVNPDITTSGTLSNDNGIAIRFGAENTGTIVDSVAWGEAANTFVEGTVFATNPGANESINRKTGSGYIDTGNNANDFELKTCLTPKAPTCAGPNRMPNAVFIFTPTAPDIDKPIDFDATGSGDPDGSITYYLWEFGDPYSSGALTTTSSTNATTTHIYSSAGTFSPRLTVFDDQNGSSTTSVSITISNPAPPPPSGSQPASSILFQQPDNSGEIVIIEGYNNGSLSFPLGSGVDGSANKLKIKFKPEGVIANNRFYIAPWRIKEVGGLEFDFWYAGNEPYVNQPKYCFTTGETDIWKEVTFTFASSLNFSASKTYDLYLLFKKDLPERVCNNDNLTGTGSSAQGTWAANAANSLIYFQIGNNL